MLPGNTPRIFLDTDVAFDIISKREPHFHSSIQFLHLTIAGKIKLVISESSLANLIYLSIDIYKIKDAVLKLSEFIGACELVHAGKEVSLIALNSAFKDKEDALQYHMALYAEVDYFITRNLKDYKKFKAPNLPVYLPNEFFKLVSK
jgi:predicted nucleic acid-binding protein